MQKIKKSGGSGWVIFLKILIVSSPIHFGTWTMSLCQQMEASSVIPSFLVLAAWNSLALGNSLRGFSLKQVLRGTFSLQEELAHRAARWDQLHWPLVFSILQPKVCSKVHQQLHQLHAAIPGSRVQRGVQALAAVHVCSWTTGGANNNENSHACTAAHFHSLHQLLFLWVTHKCCSLHPELAPLCWGLVLQLARAQLPLAEEWGWE